MLLEANRRIRGQGTDLQAAEGGDPPRQARGDRLVRLAPAGQPRRPGDAARAGARRRARPRPRAARFGTPRHAAGSGAHQRRCVARGGVRRHLARRGLPPGEPGHLRRARRGAGAGSEWRALPARRHRRLRGVHPHRRCRDAFPLQVLAYDRHRRHVRRGRRRRDAPRLQPRAVLPTRSATPAHSPPVCSRRSAPRR